LKNDKLEQETNISLTRIVGEAVHLSQQRSGDIEEWEGKLELLGFVDEESAQKARNC
jgi:hypothetical protein